MTLVQSHPFGAEVQTLKKDQLCVCVCVVTVMKLLVKVPPSGTGLSCVWLLKDWDHTHSSTNVHARTHTHTLRQSLLYYAHGLLISCHLSIRWTLGPGNMGMNLWLENQTVTPPFLFFLPSLLHSRQMTGQSCFHPLVSPLSVITPSLTLFSFLPAL